MRGISTLEVNDRCHCRPYSSIRTLVVSADGGGGAVGAGASEMKRSSLARAGMGTDRYLNKPS